MCVLLACIATGETLDEAVRVLAGRLAVRLDAPRMPLVTLHNISPLSTVDAELARSSLQSALRMKMARLAPGIEITLTVSRDIRGYLLVAECDSNGQHIVEMEGWQADATATIARKRSRLDAGLLWEQDSAMLDLAVNGDRMFILEPGAIVMYMRGAAGWERPDSHVLDGAPVVRDPRGRLVISSDSLTAFLPGVTCRGTWTTAVDVRCESGSAAFPLDGGQARFTPGRNTLDVRPHAIAESEPWGDDFVSLDSGCARGEILATAPGDRASPDSITAFEMSDAHPTPASEPVEVPGPVLALWPAETGALAIVKNVISGRYAAYNISIDCSR